MSRLRRGCHRCFLSRYLDALAVVWDPTAKVKELDKVARATTSPSGRRARGFNPIAREDVELFAAVMDGAHHLRGFTNRDLRSRLTDSKFLSCVSDESRRSAKVGRLLHRLHAHGLLAKIPRSRRWRTTGFGRRLMVSSLQIREVNFPQLLALAA